LSVDGLIQKHKAQLVSKGFSQKEGVDYTETFSPIARMDIVWMVFPIVTSMDWKVN